MKTVLIRGTSHVPEALHDILHRGSTSFIERGADEVLDARTLDADRIVVWSGTDPCVRAVAAKLADAVERDTLIVITSGDAGDVVSLPPGQLYVWPRDEDRLRMAFMTGG